MARETGSLGKLMERTVAVNSTEERQPMSACRWAVTLRPFLVLLSLRTPGAALTAAPSPPRDLQPTIHKVLQALTHALPWSLDTQQCQNPANRQCILEAWGALAGNTAGLTAHGQGVRRGQWVYFGGIYRLFESTSASGSPGVAERAALSTGGFVRLEPIQAL